MSLNVETLLLNYGLAGVVVYVFYKLCSNELKDLKSKIEELNENIDELIRELRKR